MGAYVLTSFAALALSHHVPHQRPSARQCRIRIAGPVGRCVEPLEHRVLLSGTASFADPLDILVGGIGAVPGDFNGDGRTDFVVADADAQLVRVFPGDRSGRFGPPVVTAAPNIGGFVAVGDFNRDGKLDLAQPTPANARITVMTGDGRGGLGAPASFPAGGDNPAHPVAADFNRDGNLDLATSGFVSGNVRVQFGDGAGHLSAARVYPIPFNTLGLVAADFNGDGSADLAVSDWGDGTVSILTNDGAGNFTIAPFDVGGDTITLCVGDFNRDGKPDLAAGIGSLGGQEQFVSILLNDGAGRFGPPAIVPGPARAGFAVADFDADGAADLAVRNPGGRSVTFLLGDGAGGFADAGTLAAGDSQASITAADFNNDGRPDLALGNGDSRNLTLLLNAAGAGGLVIDGTAGNDRISAELGAAGTSLLVIVNGVTTNYPLAGMTGLTLRGLAGKDRIKVSSAVRLAVTLDGGPGSDSLMGGGGNDTLLGGDGNDTLDGRGGADLFRGGAGTDTADYTLRKKSVSVGIGTAADDGEAGEGDNVFSDVENVWGGRGNDTIRGSSGNNRLAGGAGDDVLVGRGGKDTLLGGDGNDQLFARDGDRIPDSLDGGDGTDAAQNDPADFLTNIERSTGIDVTPPQVVGVSVEPWHVFERGPVTLQIRFSEPMNATGLDPHAFYADSGSYNGVFSDDASYDASGTVLSIRFNDLRDSFYGLSIGGGAGDLRDRAGLPLGGPGVVDGIYDFFFVVDTGPAVALPVPDPLPPGGALIPADSVLWPATDSDSFTVDLRAGQAIAVDLSVHIDGSIGALTSTVILTGPDGRTLGSVTSGGWYQDVSLPPVVAPSDGTYTVTVHAAPGEAGRFQLAINVGGA